MYLKPYFSIAGLFFMQQWRFHGEIHTSPRLKAI